MQNQIKNCQKCKLEFEIDQDELSFYEKMKVPVPIVCPDCRFKMRAVWRNEMSLYSGLKCGKCEKSIIAIYNPKLPYEVYCRDCYTGDSWDATSYAQNYDFNKPFFEQLDKLFKKVPKKNLFIDSANGPIINSDYANCAGGMKNCYMVFNGGVGEEIMYCRGIVGSKEVNDCYFGEHLELSYECVNTNKSSGIIFGNNSVNCVNSQFISSCSGLTDCFGCVNLRNKSNCWFNEQLSHDEYKGRVDEIMGSYQKMTEIQNQYSEFVLKFPHRENNNIKAYGSIGDYLFECNNLKNSFEVTGSENCKYMYSVKYSKDCCDVIGFGYQSERLFNVVSIGFSSNIIGSHTVENSQNILYSFSLKNCHDCIGCDGLKNSSYCILNKQYSKEEYEKIRDIIFNELIENGTYGLMIPAALSFYAYNETIAQDNFPLTKEQALAEGFRWEDNIQMTKGKETLQPEEIPDHIKDVKDSITEEILKCINCERNYKITEQELLFYRKMNLPIPHQCFFCRHQDRIKRRGPYKFWDRKCDNCGKDIKTNYSPDRKEIIYCEQCYQQEVI